MKKIKEADGTIINEENSSWNKFTFERWPFYEEDEIENLMKVLVSKKWGGIFENSENELLELEFSQYNNIDYCVTACNGTIGLYMALKALSIGEGDEVILPSYSYIASATAVTWSGATPVFVDIEPETFCIDPNKIEMAITNKTKALLPVHMWGNVCNMIEIMKTAQQYGLYVVEDCSQAIGAMLNGKKVGTFGDIGLYSFAFNKSLSAGEGAALVSEKEDIKNNLIRLKNHGRLRADTNMHKRLGWNFRMSEFSATIARAQLKRLDETINKKLENLALLENSIKSSEIKYLKILETHVNIKRSPFGVILLFDQKFCKMTFDEFTQTLNELNIPISRREYLAMPDNFIYNAKNTSCLNSRDNSLIRIKDLIIIGQPLGSAVLMSDSSTIKKLIEKLKQFNI